MSPLFTTHIRPLLEYSSSLWNIGYLGDLRMLEGVQRRWTKTICGMEHLTYLERLKSLNLYSIQVRLLRHDLIKYWQIFHGASSIKAEDLFHRSAITHTRGHQYKIFCVHSQLDIRRRSFSIRSINTWNALPPSVISSQTVTTFKTSLSNHLGDILFHYC